MRVACSSRLVGVSSHTGWPEWTQVLREVVGREVDTWRQGPWDCGVLAVRACTYGAPQQAGPGRQHPAPSDVHGLQVSTAPRRLALSGVSWFGA